MSSVRRLLGATTLLAMTAIGAGAQTVCEASAPVGAPYCARASVVTAVVAQILRLELSSLNTAFTPPDVAQFDSSRVASALEQLPLTTGPVVTVRANRPWRLTVAANEPSFTFTPDPLYRLTHPTGKSASDLAWSISVSNGYRPLTAESPQEVAQNASRGSYSQYTVFYRTRWRYDVDVPGTYALSISYTLTGQ